MIKKLLGVLNNHDQGDALVHNVIVIVDRNNCFVLGRIHGVFIHNVKCGSLIFNSLISELIEDDDYWSLLGGYINEKGWGNFWLEDKLKVLKTCYKILDKDYTKLKKVDGFKIRTLE